MYRLHLGDCLEVMATMPADSFHSIVTDPPTRKNIHPTVKPTELMRYLCAMVTPEGGRILDPFLGSGSTGRGAMLGGFLFEGIEREAEYVEISKRRIAAIKPQAIQGRFI